MRIKTEICPSIAPDHNGIYISLSSLCESPRGPGNWKFKNISLQDEESVEWARDCGRQTGARNPNLNVAFTNACATVV